VYARQSSRCFRRSIALFAVGLALAGCKREAHEQLRASTLFPKTPGGAENGGDPAFGAMARATEVAEVEPNDGLAKAQKLPASAVVKGTVGPPGDVPGATDFYAIPGHPGAGRVARIELIEAPACTEIAVFSVGSSTPLQVGRVAKTGRSVLDAVGLTAAGLVVRIRCVAGKKDERAPVGGGYRLRTGSRTRTAGEEQEPNEKPLASGPVVAPGQVIQATLSRPGDVDVFSLRTGDAGSARQPLTLAVAGVPNVIIGVELRQADGQVRLKRVSTRGRGISIPNLAPGLLRGVDSVAVAAISGAQADHRYAVALSPPDCAGAAGCLGGRVDEREPNDRRADAAMLRFDHRLKGLLDGRKDADWYAIDVDPGTTVGFTVKPPEGVRAKVMVSSPPSEPLWVIGPHKGGVVEVARYVAGGPRVYVRVMGVKGSHDPAAAYSIEAANISEVDAALDLSGLVTPTLAPAATPVVTAD